MAGLVALVALSALGAKPQGCDKQDPASERLIPPGVSDFLSDADILALEDAGFPVNVGTTPPTLGKVLADSLVFTYDDDGDEGMTAEPYTIKFINQTKDGQITLKFSGVSGEDTGTGLGAFISGQDGWFSVFVPVKGTIKGCSYSYPMIISGRWTKDGIDLLREGLIMKSKSGTDCAELMNVGSRRIVSESDVLAARLCEDVTMAPGQPAKPPVQTPAGQCQKYKAEGSYYPPDYPHWYVCCNDCTTSDDLPKTCVTYDTGSDYDLCGVCGAPIWQDSIVVEKEPYDCGGPSGELRCRASCDASGPTAPGFCWHWADCFHDCCVNGGPSSTDGYKADCSGDPASETGGGS